MSIHQFATSKDIKRIVDNLYVVKPRRTDTNRSRLLEEEEFKRCTFKPETTHYKRSKSQLGVKSFEQVVERMHRGRKEKQDKQVAY